MAKIIGVHQFELKPGVKPEDFEQAMREEIAKALDLRGTRMYLTKGERGEQVGDYLIMWEFESVERRNEIFPVQGQSSEECQRWIEATASLWQTLSKMTTRKTPFTDYVVIASS